MHIRGLWRYPVKSMQGEACAEIRLSDVGVVGDRSFGVLDVASQTIVSAKRDGRLLQAGARFSGQELLVTLPTGDELGPAAYWTTVCLSGSAAAYRWCRRPGTGRPPSRA